MYIYLFFELYKNVCYIVYMLYRFSVFLFILEFVRVNMKSIFLSAKIWLSAIFSINFLIFSFKYLYNITYKLRSWQNKIYFNLIKDKILYFS